MSNGQNASTNILHTIRKDANRTLHFLVANVTITEQMSTEIRYLIRELRLLCIESFWLFPLPMFLTNGTTLKSVLRERFLLFVQINSGRVLKNAIMLFYGKKDSFLT